jgi:hemoglobin
MTLLHSDQSLYKRLGGYDPIAAAVDDLLARLHSDPQLGGYWKGTSSDSHRRDRQLIVDFMVEAAGGPVFYTGRDMKTSHVGLAISENDWQVFMLHAAATLDTSAVPAKEKDEVLAFLTALKGEIVERG